MNTENISEVTFSATYSAEDNKLRIECSERWDAELYGEMRELGFVWAPKQKLFFAAWSPNREDKCMALAGDIEPEELTVLERAELKVARLEGYQANHIEKAERFSKLASQIHESLGCQPVLYGHHSQRKAERMQSSAERAEQNAQHAIGVAGYLQEKARGSIRFANMKANPRVRANRIKTLLAELRDEQRWINHGHAVVKFWTNLKANCPAEKLDATVKHNSGNGFSYGRTYKRLAPDSMWSRLESDKISTADALDEILRWGEAMSRSTRRLRTIAHILGRLGYERSELGGTSRFSGELTATILKGFARTNGADSPECKKVDGHWELTSSVPLPVHLVGDAEKCSLTLDNEEWLDLMVDVGYEVPAAKPTKAAIPLLNLNLQQVVVRNPYHRREFDTLPVKPMTKAEYAKIYTEYKGTRFSQCGLFRIRVAYVGSMCERKLFAVYITDSKEHAMPPSLVFEEAKAS